MPLTPAYRSYLKSPQWQRKRARIFERANGTCEIAGCTAWATEIHHKTYARIFCEDLDDLLALCTEHHRQLHRIEPADNRPKSANAMLEAFGRGEWPKAANDNWKTLPLFACLAERLNDTG